MQVQFEFKSVSERLDRRDAVLFKMRETNRSLQNLSHNKKLSDREKLSDQVEDVKLKLEEKEKETKVAKREREIGQNICQLKSVF